MNKVWRVTIFPAVILAVFFMNEFQLPKLDFQLGGLEAEARPGGRGGGPRGGPRGGGRPSFSRHGPAAGGGFRSGGFGRSGGGVGAPRRDYARPGGGVGTPGNRPLPGDRPGDPQQRQDRQEAIKERQDQRQDARQDRLDDRQRYRDQVRSEYAEYEEDQEREEWYEDRWRRRGTWITVNAFRTLDCSAEVIYVGNVNYYRCGNTWYQRAYQGSEVVYVVVAAPPGY